MLGTLYIISAPSGCGKTSLVNAMLQSATNMMVSISYTTRAPRPGEQDGVNYHFVDQATFEKMIEQEEFLEYAKVFDNFYGTSRTKVTEQLEQGIDVVLEIDWQGARQICERFSNTLSIFILPPSKSTLLQRLQSRRQDNEQVINQRMALAHQELSHYHEYDYLIFNDNFDYALSDLNAIVHARRLRTENQRLRYKDLIKDLLAE
ncbi:MAG: gmk [Gammaproteobacteria bacterium]|jgi:guanylate kinase|nr:gmk [Gammaproteobacteria bacterium]